MIDIEWIYLLILMGMFAGGGIVVVFAMFYDIFKHNLKNNIKHEIEDYLIDLFKDDDKFESIYHKIIINKWRF